MLTAFQTRTVAYMGDGFIIHDHCRVNPGDEELQPLSQFEVDEIHDGWTCDRCMDWVVEPDEDYCLEHEGWRHPNVETVCERGTAGFEEMCRFYGEADRTEDEAPGMTLAELLGEEE